jgi:IMP-specific 5'-nucleotidase
MKSMLQHSFVLDALETTGADTFSHFEMLIEEHRELTAQQQNGNDLECLFPTSRLKQLVPTIGVFHTPLPLRAAFEVYNEKHRLTKRKHIQVSFNECRHILNLAQIMALRKVQQPEAQKVLATTLNEDAQSVEKGNEIEPSKPDAISSDRRKFRMESIGSFIDLGEDGMLGDLAGFNGPKLISFDGDQTLYSDGQNFERNPRLAFYLYLLLRHGVTIAVVTAAGYEYMVRRSCRCVQCTSLSLEGFSHSSELVWLPSGGEVRVSSLGAFGVFPK